MSKNITNKTILFISSLLSLILLFLKTNYPSHKFCYEIDVCIIFLKYLKILFLIAPIILFFSIVSFLINKEHIYITWRKYTFIFLLFYFIIVSITPWYIGDGLLNIQKAEIAFLGLGLYSIISLILLIVQTLKKPKIS